MARKPLAKNRILRTYLVSLAVSVSVWGLSLDHDWKHYEQDEIDKLVDQATVTNNQLESALLDASRLVDSARQQFESKITRGGLSDQEAHDILNATVAGFKIYKGKNPFGLLFFIDKDGYIRAENSSYPAPHINVADRLYFRKILEDPARPWYVGDQVIGRRNNQRVFHYVVPLTGKNGVFAGMLLQQINLDEISRLHPATGAQQFIKLLVFQADGFLSFEHPYRPDEVVDHETSARLRHELLQAANPDRDSGELSVGKPPAAYYVGYNRSNVFGLVSLAYVSVATARASFIEAQSTSLFIALAGWMLISYLFFRLYKENRATELAYEISLRDPLTNIHNRRALDEEFPRLWREARRSHGPISVAFLDIDHFKRFNDQYGHEAGDLALKAVSNALVECIQRPLDFICRWGGEEFVVVLPNTDRAAALDVVICAMDHIRGMSIEVCEGRHEKLTVSVGLATAHVTASNFDDDLIDMADKAMLDAKAAGRDRLHVFGQAYA